jgi:hypothetical protein
MKFHSREGIVFFTTTSTGSYTSSYGCPGIIRDKTGMKMTILYSAEWSCTSSPSCIFMAWYLIKHRDNFTFSLHHYYYYNAKSEQRRGI